MEVTPNEPASSGELQKRKTIASMVEQVLKDLKFRRFNKINSKLLVEREAGTDVSPEVLSRASVLEKKDICDWTVPPADTKKEETEMKDLEEIIMESPDLEITQPNQ